MYDWNDLRHFLAVARTGSTLAASRQLRISQATVSRRVTAFEEVLGLKLFVRRPSGYSLTPRGEALLPFAEEIEAATQRLDAAVASEARRLTGKVRLTTVESAANAWVIPALARLREQGAEIEVEILTSDHYLDLTHGEADIAVRFGKRPEQETLVARHIAELEECFYASRELVTRLGRPTDYADIARYPLVSATLGSTGPVGRWIEANVPDAQIVHRVNSVSGMVAAVRSGIGAAILPCIMGDDLRGLVRLAPAIPELTFPCWLVTTEPVRRLPHVRAVIDAVVGEVQRAALRIRGEPPDALSA